MSHFWALVLGSRCTVCAQPATATICTACRDRARYSVPVAGAVLSDDEGFDRMVRTFKRGAVRQLSDELANLTLERWGAGRLDLPEPDELDLITWVPHAPTRAAQRGCHAPELFARALGIRLGLPCHRLLRRSIDAPQRGRSVAGRRAHAQRSFATIDSSRGYRLVPGMHALLVDDVRTTGATLAACAHLLHQLGLVTSQLAIVSVPRYFPHRGGRQS